MSAGPLLVASGETISLALRAIPLGYVYGLG